MNLSCLVLITLHCWENSAPSLAKCQQNIGAIMGMTAGTLLHRIHRWKQSEPIKIKSKRFVLTTLLIQVPVRHKPIVRSHAHTQYPYLNSCKAHKSMDGVFKGALVGLNEHLWDAQPCVLQCSVRAQNGVPKLLELHEAAAHPCPLGTHTFGEVTKTSDIWFRNQLYNYRVGKLAPSFNMRWNSIWNIQAAMEKVLWGKWMGINKIIQPMVN